MLAQRLSAESWPTATDARALVEHVFRNLEPKRFAVRFWDGSEVSWQPEPERDFTLVFRDAATFAHCCLECDPSALAEAYVDGGIDLEGDPATAVSLASYLRTVDFPLAGALRESASRPIASAGRRSNDNDARDVRAHYDLSDDFFRLFLDRRMVYSCAYFAEAAESLEHAQERKLDLVCRKLALRPGDELLDIGCGWGALLIWAAGHYGVRGCGLTLSQNQAAEARRRVAAAGLGDRVEIAERHYSELPAGRFDKVASVGMVEHVGVPRYGEYFDAVLRTLRPGGLLLNHGITRARHAPGRSGGDFILEHVFPGAELDDIAHTLAVIEETGFEVVDVQALRPHYALTLREWARRFRARRHEAARLVPERVLRTWDLYLPGCARAFDEGWIGVHQVLAAKPDGNGTWPAPLTREALLFRAGPATPEANGGVP